MFELKLTCDNCGKNEIRESVDFFGWLRDGGNKIYCSQKCKDEAETPKVSKAAIGLAHSLMYCLSVDNVNFLTKGIEELLLKQRKACNNAFFHMPDGSPMDISKAILSAQIEE